MSRAIDVRKYAESNPSTNIVELRNKYYQEAVNERSA